MIVILVEIKNIIELDFLRRLYPFFICNCLWTLNSLIFPWPFQHISNNEIFGYFWAFYINTCRHFMQNLVYLWNSIKSLYLFNLLRQQLLFWLVLLQFYLIYNIFYLFTTFIILFWICYDKFHPIYILNLTIWESLRYK